MTSEEVISILQRLHVTAYINTVNVEQLTQIVLYGPYAVWDSDRRLAIRGHWSYWSALINVCILYYVLLRRIYTRYHTCGRTCGSVMSYKPRKIVLLISFVNGCQQFYIIQNLQNYNERKRYIYSPSIMAESVYKCLHEIKTN